MSPLTGVCTLPETLDALPFYARPGMGTEDGENWNPCHRARPWPVLQTQHAGAHPLDRCKNERRIESPRRFAVDKGPARCSGSADPLEPAPVVRQCLRFEP